MRKHSKIILFVILASGMIIRLIFFLQFQNTPFYRHPNLDALYYDELAQKVASGSIIQNQAFFMGPLYPYVMGGLYALFGHAPPAPRILQMLFGLGACVLIFILGKKIYNEKTGLIGAFFYAFYKPVLFYEQTLLSETSMAFFCLVFLYLVFLADERKKLIYYLLSGFSLGICVLFRGNVLLFAPFALAWLIWGMKRATEQFSTKSIAVFSMVFALGVAAGILPATIHNLAAEKDFVLVTSNAGFNFYIGNHPGADGLFEIPDRVDMDNDPSGSRIAEKDAGKTLKSSEISSYWMQRGVKFVKNNPWNFIKLLAVKFYHFWGRLEIPQIYSMRLMSNFMPVLKWPLIGFALIGPLSLMGIIMNIMERERRKLLFVLFVIVYCLSLLPFFMTARYRIPVIPVLCIPAAAIVLSVVHSIQNRKWKRLIILAAGVVIIFALSGNAFLFEEERETSQFYNALGLIYMKENETEKAVESYRKAIIAYPTSYAYANLANIYYQNNQPEQAVKFYSKALAMEADNARIHFNIGQALLSLRRIEKAREHFEKAVAIDRRVHPNAWYNLGVIYKMKGMKQKSENAMREFKSLRKSVNTE